MASPFRALSPFTPRVIEINYAAFAPECPPEPPPEAILTVGYYLNNLCGTNVDLGVLPGNSVQTINELINSMGLLSLVLGTVQFSGSPGVTLLDDPSGNIVPSGQSTGLGFQFTVPNAMGNYSIDILIPSNDPISPCVYSYIFSVAGFAGIRVSGPAGSDLCGNSFGPSYTPTGQFTIDDIIHSTGAINLVTGTVTVTQGAQTVTWSTNPSNRTINPGGSFQMHGLINLPASGAFDIVVTIPSNDANSPCVYHYIGYIIEPITYQWYGATDAEVGTNTWHLLVGDSYATLDAKYQYDVMGRNNFKCLVSCPSGVAVAAGIGNYILPPTLLHYYFTASASHDPLGPTSIYSDIGSIVADF